MENTGKLGILVGGGPAPGTNSVIAAAAIRGNLAGVEVMGLMDGYSHLRGRTTPQRMGLPIDVVSQSHFRGGSLLRTSREVPADPSEDQAVINTLRVLGVTRLVTIGGDETCKVTMRLARLAPNLSFVHVPKTIDNDLPLPPGIQTLGYETARHVGVGIIRDLLVDAKTMGRWYFVTTMGRSAGHLALGIGKAAGATLSLIPEELPAGRLTIDWLVDTLVGAIIKRLAGGRKDGIAILAEGLAEWLPPEEIALVRRASNGASSVRLGDLRLGEVVRDRVQDRLSRFGVRAEIAEKSIGYELRSADPIPFDMEYARDLGYSAAKFLLEGGKSAMITMVAGKFTPVGFAEMESQAGAGLQVRPVDTATETYKIARRYMIRLRRDDFEDEALLAHLAATANMTSPEFRKRFAPLVHDEAPPLRFLAKAASVL